MSAQFPCTKEDCTEVFTKKSQLKIHILLKHPETNEEETRKRKAIDIEIDNLAKKVAKTNESSSTTEDQNGGTNGHQNGSGQEKPFQMPTILADPDADEIIPVKKVIPLGSEETAQGHFGWVDIGKVLLPFIVRSGKKYMNVKMVETKLLPQFINLLPAGVASCCTIKSQAANSLELELINEINQKHCEDMFGKDAFKEGADLVSMSDIKKLYNYLELCRKKLVLKKSGSKDKCGFIRVNKKDVIPFLNRDENKFLPLFFFEGLKGKGEEAVGWEMTYIRFCCLINKINHPVLKTDKCELINMEDIKQNLGPDVGNYWPLKPKGDLGKIEMSKPGGKCPWEWKQKVDSDEQ